MYSGLSHIRRLKTVFFFQKKTLRAQSPVVFLKPNEECTHLAVGHLNGSLSIYDLETEEEEQDPEQGIPVVEPNVTFEGHTSKQSRINLF